MEYLERLNELIGKDNMDQFYDFLRVRSIQRDLAIAFATLGTVLKVSYQSLSFLLPFLSLATKVFLIYRLYNIVVCEGHMSS